MADDPTKPNETLGTPPVSASRNMAEALLKARALDSPPRPGLLAAVDRFEILEVIGQGGMGVVLLARDPATDTRVAIKMLQPDLAREPRLVKRFLIEAKHMYKLDHGSILRVLEVSDRLAGPYYVMPYKPRGSLAALIQPGQPLDEATTLAIARYVAEALAYAHAQGLIHRDVKPHNVLLDPDGRAHLADFGLVRTVFNDSLIEPGHEGRLGTVAYMSPAVARGEAEDTRCDIYSFGAMLYEMLTGEPPYSGQTRDVVLLAVLAGPPKPVPTLNPKAPAGLATICEGCMARELRERYASMDDVVRDLDLIAEGQAAIGPHGPARSRWQRQVGGVLLSGVAALVIAGALYAWHFWPTEHDRRQASSMGDADSPLGNAEAGTPPMDSQLYKVVNEWPVVFEDPLTSEDCLSRAFLARGLESGKRAFEVLPGQGLMTRGFYNSVAWWNTPVGSEYAFSMEFRPDSPPDNFIRVWLSGPGYGTSWGPGYLFTIWADKAGYDLSYNAQIVPRSQGRFKERLNPDAWHQLVLVKTAQAISAFLGGEHLGTWDVRPAPNDALHSFVGIGSGSAWYGPTACGVTYRNLSVRMPRREASQLTNRVVRRTFDPPDAIPPAPNGTLLFTHAFPQDGMAAWHVASSADAARVGPSGLALDGNRNQTPLVWREEAAAGEVAVEWQWECAPDQDAAQFYLCLALDDPRTTENFAYRGAVMRVPNHMGDNAIAWMPGRSGVPKTHWDDGNARGWRDVAAQPCFAPIPGRPYTLRAEKRGTSLCVFLNGGFLMKAELPVTGAPDTSVYVGFGNSGGLKTVRSVRAWRLGDDRKRVQDALAPAASPASPATTQATTQPVSAGQIISEIADPAGQVPAPGKIGVNFRGGRG